MSGRLAIVGLMMVMVACGGPQRQSRPPGFVPAGFEQVVNDADRAFDKRDWDRAAERYEAAARARPMPVHVYVHRAELYRRSREPHAGLAFLREHVEARGWRVPEILDQKVALLAAAGDKEAALHLAAEVAEMGGRVYEAAFLLCRPAAGDWARHCRRFLAQRPERHAQRDVLPLIYVAYSLLADRHVDEARLRLAEAQRRFPHHRLVTSNEPHFLCAIHAWRGAHELAIEACQRASQHCDRANACFYNLTTANLGAGRVDDARLSAESYVRAARGGGKSLVLLARLADHDGRPFEAPDLERRPVTALDSGRAQVALARRDLGVAEALALEHVTLYPWDAAGWRFLAEVRERQGYWIARWLALFLSRSPDLAQPLEGVGP